MKIFIPILVIVLAASPARCGEIVFEPNIEYANPDNQHLQLNLARPKDVADAARLPAVICIHGGGFRAGNRTRWDGLCKELAGRGTFVSDGSSHRASGLIGMILPSVVRARNPELIGGAEETARR